MKYSYHWLKELSGTKKSPQQLAEMLMTHSFEVEGIEKFPHGLDGIVVGKVISLKQHPNADKLRVAEVEVKKNDIRQIVCGAPNIALGQKVAVALPGVKLPASPAGGPGGIEIKVAELRGVESRGMVCSARELGLGDEHTGILVLPEDTPVGVSFAGYFGLDDSIIEVKILPDRGADALAYRGMAREIAALDGHIPRFVGRGKRIVPISTRRAPRVSIKYQAGCARYIGIRFGNISVHESPLWLKAKLMLSGMRPVNNIVDSTNYLMLLFGQPMHAFDADKITGAVVVRRAVAGESLTLLTGETKTLSAEDIVIADDARVLALAGVMGGAYAAVTKETKNIFFEIANFDGPTVRRMKGRHNLPTDASYRFERGLDPNLPGETVNEACSLIVSLAGGVCVGMRDVYPRVQRPWRIRLPLALISGVLGKDIPPSEAQWYLMLLGLAVKKDAKKKAFTVTVPTRRPDLRDEWNLIEEIGRLYSYGQIPAQAPLAPLAPAAQNPAKRFEREAKEYLAHAGFDELMTYSFYGEKDLRGALLPLDHHLELENPLSPEQKYLRMSPVPLLLRKTRENLRHFDRFDCFEWGRAYARNPKMQAPAEVSALLLMTVLPQKSEKGEAFFAMKGKVAAMFEALHIDTSAITFELPETFPEILTMAMLHPTRSACIAYRGSFIGVIGEFHPKVLKAFGLEPRVAMAGFLTDALQQSRKEDISYVPLQKFPYALRDISLTFPSASRRSVTVAEAEALLREAGTPLLRRYELFDIYEQDGEKSLAFHLSFGADDRTLSGEEMDSTFGRIVASAAERFGARLRDK
ncbi:MAG: phenylalanine--tRNA ligase subunit beta [Patescibacteria group bacterium]